MADCLRCQAPHAPFGLGPPLVATIEHYCGACIGFQPASQKALAVKVREVVEDGEISAR